MRTTTLTLGLLLIGCKQDPAPSPASSSTDIQTAPLKVGDRAPKVSMTLQDGKKLTLSSLEGQPVAVYFYPKDDTRGCTIQAQGVRDNHALFKFNNLRVLGVSTQDAPSHQAFIDKHELPFDLVVDTDGAVARAFRVPLKAGLAARQTFLIDQFGFIKNVWLNVDPQAHAQELIAALPRD